MMGIDFLIVTIVLALVACVLLMFRGTKAT